MLRRILERTFLVCGGFGVALIALETILYFGYRGWGVGGRRFDCEAYWSAMVETASGARSTSPERAQYWTNFPQVMHPYLGSVPDPARTGRQTTIGDPGQILARSDSDLIVGVFGGSFASGVCTFGGGELRRVLAQPGREVQLICAAAGGYKQPQQFLALAYLLAQGAHFDLVINIDGFNEVALPAENIKQGVAPQYPYGWFWLVGNVTDPGALKLLGELSVLDHKRKVWADLFARWPLYRSALLAFLWENRDRLIGIERARILEELRDHKIEQQKTYATTGPTMIFADDRSLDDYLARVWKDSSLQMKLLCDANRIAYAHFLQPNQHVPDSKPMAPQELKFVAEPGSYGLAVVRGYPLLRRQGEELQRAGVRFHDLTMVFSDVRDPVYSDGCCHLTGAGYAMIARVIGDSIGGDAAAFQMDQSVHGKATPRVQ